MARLSQAPVISSRSVSNADSFNDLNRLLARLQQSILHADADREKRLRTSEYERNKVAINLEYARTLLTKLEQDALSVKVHSRRQEMQMDLNRKRDIFEQLTERLRELEEISIDDDEDSSDEEDLLGELIETPNESVDSLPGGPHGGSAHRDEDYKAEEEEEEEDESTVMPEPRRSTVPSAPEASESREIQIGSTAPADFAPQAATTTSQTLRSRNTNHPASQPEPPEADTAGHSSAREKLFAKQSGGTAASATTAVSTATAEAILDNHRQEQERLTESLLSMATALKSSSRAFASSLEGERDVLGAAAAGLESSERGLEAAARRMGALRRMSEGSGWWGRIVLYAWIFGMMVGAILLVFVLPKLRF